MAEAQEVLCGACQKYRQLTPYRGYCNLLISGPKMAIRKDFSPQANLRAEGAVEQAEKIEKGEVICFSSHQKALPATDVQSA